MEIAFHVTLAENCESILATGLQARIGPRSRMLESRPAVFLFPDRQSCDTALSTWLGDEFEDVPEDGLVILAVDITGLPYQFSVEFEREVLADIPHERIVAIWSEGWEEL